MTDESDGAHPNPTLFGTAWPIGWRSAGVLVAWCAVVIGVFTLVGELIERSPIADLDRRVAQDVVETRTPTGNDVAPWVAGMADTFVKIGVTTLIVLIMFIVWRRWLEPVIVTVSLVFEATAFIVVTTIVARPRPEVEHLQDSPVDSSFPSGHVAAATAYGAIALVISRRLRHTWAKVAVWTVPPLIVVAVAWARLYLGMHYLSDVIAGAVLGAVSIYIVDRVVRNDPRSSPRTGDERELDDAHDGERGRGQPEQPAASRSPVTASPSG